LKASRSNDGKRMVGSTTSFAQGELKVSGGTIYAADVVLPRMLWVKILRSPIPHGRITRLDTRGAVNLSGVSAVLTGADLGSHRIGKTIIDMPLLADGVVRFIGENVVAVAAESEAIAEQALELIEIDYEELETVFDPLEALKPSAPILHPDLPRYSGLLHEIQDPTNLTVHLAWKKGDVGDGFDHSDVVVENIFRTASVHHGHIEPHAYLVSVDPNGYADIWASTKMPFLLRDQVARSLGILPEKLVVHPCNVGGDFGGKGYHNDVALCYVLSRKSGQPVKMVVDYVEELTAGNLRHASVIQMKTGVKKDGHLVAQHIHFVFDSGAYAAYRSHGFLREADKSAGAYRIPHVLIEEDYVYTNKVPAGYMRAPGHAQGCFAMESQMNLVAQALGMDPADLRKINFMRDGDESPLGDIYGHVRGEEVLQRALEESVYYSPKPANVGRGCAVAQWVSKGGEGYAYVTISEDSSVKVSAAVIDVGTGVYTMMRQIVAKELEIPIDSVQVEALDTTKVIKDTGVRASSGTRVHGGAAHEAAKKAREEILRWAGSLMGAAPEDLVLHAGGVTHARAERRLTYKNIVTAKGSPIVTEGYYSNMTEGPEVSMNAQVVEVEVDRETGEVKIRQVTTANSIGTILNPLTHQGQIDGSVIMGMGYAKMEEVVFDDSGRVITANLGESKIPTVQELFPLKTVLVPTPVGSGPYNSMSIAEAPFMATAPAIANAIADAVGVRIMTLPITAEKVLRALQGSRPSGPVTAADVN
jgi:CO/xanthine dehydrogenase Mo-binding subunit